MGWMTTEQWTLLIDSGVARGGSKGARAPSSCFMKQWCNLVNIGLPSLVTNFDLCWWFLIIILTEKSWFALAWSLQRIAHFRWHIIFKVIVQTKQILCRIVNVNNVDMRFNKWAWLPVKIFSSSLRLIKHLLLWYPSYLIDWYHELRSLWTVWDFSMFPYHKNTVNVAPPNIWLQHGSCREKRFF